MARAFELLEESGKQGKHLCVGLDPGRTEVAELLSLNEDGIEEFIHAWAYKLTAATGAHAAAFKANHAFWSRKPTALKQVFSEVKRATPDIALILDGKFGDIDNTSDAWADFAKWIGADAVTISPYMGTVDVTESFTRAGIDCFVTVRTSNKRSGELQKLEVHIGDAHYELADIVAKNVNALEQGMVVGATDPSSLESFSTYYNSAPFLIPGVGKQGGEAEKVAAAMSGHQAPWIVNVGRGITGVGRKGEGLSSKWMDAIAQAAKSYHERLKPAA